MAARRSSALSAKTRTNMPVHLAQKHLTTPTWAPDVRKQFSLTCCAGEAVNLSPENIQRLASKTNWAKENQIQLWLAAAHQAAADSVFDASFLR